MMDLVWQYLIVIVMLFAINIGLLLNATNLDNKKSIIFLFFHTILFFIVSLIALNLSSSLKFLSGYIEYLMFAIGVILFILILFYLYNWNKGKIVDLKIKSLTFIGTIICSIVLIFSLTALWNSHGSIFFNAGVIALSMFVISFIFMKLSKKDIKGVPGGISEYMILESILIIIFGLTFTYVKDLNYKNFTPFTILSPTYQIILLIIGVIALIIIGVLINDNLLKKNKSKN
jgi:peptidoglycan/LPS O-acetylase OafA/YrhL